MGRTLQEEWDMNQIAMRVREWAPPVVPWVDSSGGPSGLCCIGGALLIWERGGCLAEAGAMDRFPGPDRVAAALERLNPRLSLQEALEYAAYMIQANDEWRTEDAWRLLDMALNHEG